MFYLTSGLVEVGKYTDQKLKKYYKISRLLHRKLSIFCLIYRIYLYICIKFS